MEREAFAFYLNANARRVNPEVAARIDELVPPGDIFTCSSPADASAHARTILARGYPTVFTGGGDGTVVGLINALHREGGGGDLPVLGVLSLGARNALSRLVSSGSALQDLKTYVTNPTNERLTISLVECDGEWVPFGGFGLDAEILADQESWKESLGTGPLKPLFQTAGGYVASFLGTTAPRHLKAFIRGQGLSLRVVNLGERAFQVGPAGEKARAFDVGQTMYEGPVTLCAFGTVPMHRHGLRMLPFADRYPEFMDLRVSRVSYVRGLTNLPSVWSGEFRDDNLFDFYADRVRLEVSEPVAFQVAGDPAGYRDRVELAIVPRRLRLLRFL